MKRGAQIGKPGPVWTYNIDQLTTEKKKPNTTP